MNKQIVAIQRANYLAENENMSMMDSWTQLNLDGFSNEDIEYAIDIVYTKRRKDANRKAFVKMASGLGMIALGVFLSFGVNSGKIFIGLIITGLLFTGIGVYNLAGNK